MKKAVMLALVLVLPSMSTFLGFIKQVEASGSVYIKADGSIDPPTAPITTADNITYTFLGNIYDSILVGRNNIVIDGAGYTLHGTGSRNGITLLGKSNVTIKNMEIQGFTYGINLGTSTVCSIYGNTITNNEYGVRLEYFSNNNHIFGNHIVNNTFGIALYDSSSYNSVYGNNITANIGYGIWLNMSYGNDIYENYVANIGVGILSISSESNTIARNKITNSSICIMLSQNTNTTRNKITNNGVYILQSPNNSIIENVFVNCGLVFGAWLGPQFYGNRVENNTVNDKPLVYLEGVSDYTVEDAGQVILVNCNRMHVENLNLSNTTVGLQLVGTDSSRIVGNNLTNNVFGIWLSGSSNRLTGNHVTKNLQGIWLNGSSNSLDGNNITSNNGAGIYLDGSYNRIFHNNFIENAYHIQIAIQFPPYSNLPVSNVWDNGIEGNYWSNYTGVDLNHDGIGDKSHVIDANNTDNYPLMGMFYEFEATSEHNVQIICNSTVSDFLFEYFKPSEIRVISFDVMGEDGTTGFCRICIPTALMDEPYTVLVNATEVSYNLLPFSNETHSYLYFTYSHSTQEVIIIPEFPTWTSILLILALLTVAIVFYKRRLLKTPIHKIDIFLIFQLVSKILLVGEDVFLMGDDVAVPDRLKHEEFMATDPIRQAWATLLKFHMVTRRGSKYFPFLSDR